MDEAFLIDLDGLVMELGHEGLLDEDEMTDTLLALHDFLGENGLDAGNPETYRAVIASLTFVTVVGETIGLDQAIELLGRASVRGYRDLTNGG